MTAPRLLPRAIGLALALAAAAGITSACNRTKKPAGDTNPASESGEPPARSARYEIDLFAFGRQLGTIAPCGCTTDPLGGLQFAFGYIEAESDSGQRLVLEPGSFLFPDPEGPEAPSDEAAWVQARQRAELLHGRFSDIGGLVSGLGPTDYASPTGAAALDTLSLPRVSANIEASARPAGVEAMRTVDLGRGLHAAVTQVVAPELAEQAATHDWGKPVPSFTDPIAALEGLGDAFAGAPLKIVMVHGPRALAEAIAENEAVDVDVVIIGGEIDNPDEARLGSAPVRVGGAWILQPGDRGQTISHLTLSIGASVGEGELPDSWTLVASEDQLRAELERVEAKLAKFRADDAADPAFISRLEAERDELATKLEGREIAADVAVAVQPSQTKVTCRLPVDDQAKAALREYDAEVAKANLARFEGVEAPAPAPGAAGYVGIDACEDCHSEAVSFWDETVHARAYETLVEDNKQYDLSCVGCHVTGFRKPGGSEVVENQGLRSVQCEQCHGPGSLHIEDPGTDNIQLEAPRSVCLNCHTPEHSDTFQYEAYLRDVLGPGHGTDKRAELGEGPTGAQLRAEGLAKAGGGCPKM